MYYFSQKSIVDAYNALKNKIPSKFIGLLAILRNIDTDALQTNVTYKIQDAKVGNWLNDMMMMEDTELVSSDSELYTRFAANWDDYVAESMFPQSPNLGYLLVFIYKFTPFEEQPSYSQLLKRFTEDFHISNENISKWFELSSITMEFVSYCSIRNSIKIALKVSNSTLTFDGSFSVKAKASELSRAPFIQTLYAGMDSMKCLLVSRIDLEVLYPTKDNKNKSLNSNVLQSRQIIFYGAPGTGKSHKIKERLESENVPKENIFRTTFHPDSDYSTFVGAYKPTRGKKPLYGLNGSNTVRLHNNGEDLTEEVITYKFVPQAFLKAYIRAYEKPTENVYLIIEEINRGNCAQIFGDLFQLLDRDKDGMSDYTIKADDDLKDYLEDEFKRLGVSNDGIADGELCLPSNLYIYATMNTSDQSLFPIDSAFKRRWDWEYEPIKYNHDLKIKIGNETYKWTSFQKIVNGKIKDATSSEDKMLGDYFVNPSDSVIDENTLRNKILFYLWNDVCKDGEGDIFKTSETEDISFSELYGDKGRFMLNQMMNYLKVEKYADSSEEEEDEDDEEDEEFVEKDGEINSGKDRTKYSINGDNNNGKGYPKKYLAAKLVEKYIELHNGESADEVVRKWKNIGGNIVSHFIETQAEYDTRTDISPRVKPVKCNNDTIYISTNGWGGQGIMDKLINSIPQEWNLTVGKL